MICRAARGQFFYPCYYHVSRARRRQRCRRAMTAGFIFETIISVSNATLDVRALCVRVCVLAATVHCQQKQPARRWRSASFVSGVAGIPNASPNTFANYNKEIQTRRRTCRSLSYTQGLIALQNFDSTVVKSCFSNFQFLQMNKLTANNNVNRQTRFVRTIRHLKLCFLVASS